MDFKSSNIFAPTIEYAMYALYAKVGNIQSDQEFYSCEHNMGNYVYG